MQAYLHQLNVDGFAYISGLLTADRVAELVLAVAQQGGHRSSRRGGEYAVRNLLRDLPKLRELATSGELLRIAQSVLGEEAFPVRGILFDKPPQANWHVGWHQDTMIPVAERRDVPGFRAWSVKAGVVHVQPPAEVLEAMLTLRVHFDNCGAENGPLRVLPGSHQHGLLSSTEVKQWIAATAPVTSLASRGGVLAMRPLLLHASPRAEAVTHRRVLHIEYAPQPLPGGLRWHVA